MRIVTLIENAPGPGLRHEHGLSLYVQTPGHRLLSDTGASPDFLENAEKLGVDLSEVDTVVLSHGHYDHGGGIPAFVRKNPRARIYLQQGAGGDYYAMDPEGPRYIGLDKSVLSLPQVRIAAGDLEIDGELYLLSGVTGRRRFSMSNLSLREKRAGEYCQDSFLHEQSLVIREGSGLALLSGCAHNGILNILDRFRQVFGRDPDLVVSGFHFMKAGEYTPREREDILETARELAGMDTLFYTGHCTGASAFELMKPLMGEQLQALCTGKEILFDPR